MPLTDSANFQYQPYILSSSMISENRTEKFETVRKLSSPQTTYEILDHGSFAYQQTYYPATAG